MRENSGQKFPNLTLRVPHFMTDETGAIGLKDKEEAVLLATYDLDKGASEHNLSWGLFRDRRPEMYRQITRLVWEK